MIQAEGFDVVETKAVDLKEMVLQSGPLGLGQSRERCRGEPLCPAGTSAREAPG